METLNYAQRAILEASAARRVKARQLARINAAIAAAKTPDYFTWAAYSGRFMDDLRALLRAWSERQLQSCRGVDPYNDVRGMVRS